MSAGIAFAAIGMRAPANALALATGAIVLLVTGSMNLHAMILATAAITAERLAPAGTTVMWMIVAGAALMLRA
jgi:hypothetical protein